MLDAGPDPDPVLQPAPAPESAPDGRNTVDTDRALIRVPDKRRLLQTITQPVVDLAPVADGNDQNLERLLCRAVDDAPVARPP